MNIFNKNILRRTISIFLLLTLCVGLCLEAAALEEMAVRDPHEFGWGYSIMVVEADDEEGEALFWLYKEGKEIDNTTVSSGEWFRLDDGGDFHFEAILGPVFRSDNKITVRLTDYKWYKLVAVGDRHELGWGYSIEVVEADDKEGTALFRLYKEGETIDDTTVIFGEWFRLDDMTFFGEWYGGESFHFEATLGPVSRSDNKIMVRLTDYDYWYNLKTTDYVAIIVTVMFALVFIIVIIAYIRSRINEIRSRINETRSQRRQKIDEYKAKMQEWEKEGYDVSELKEVLEGEK